MITTVLLDLDDTILADDEASDLAFAATAALAPHLDAEALITQVKLAADAGWAEGPFPDWLVEVGTGPLELLRARFEGDDPHWGVMREWGPGYRRRSWQQGLAALGVTDDELAATLDAGFERARGEANPWCTGAETALAELRKHYKLGMVTNGIPDVQRKKIDETGLESLFDAIIVSGEVGYGKPHPKVYQAALDALGVTPEETIMVGDNWRRDVVGPQKLGIRGVWISMSRPRPTDDEPWLEIVALAELPEILADR